MKDRYIGVFSVKRFEVKVVDVLPLLVRVEYLQKLPIYMTPYTTFSCVYILRIKHCNIYGNSGRDRDDKLIRT